MSIKSIVSALVALSLPVSSFASLTEGRISSPKVISTVILQQMNSAGEFEAVCAADVTGRPELAPKFAKVAPVGFKSSVQVDLPQCSNQQMAELADQAGRATKAQVAALPALVIAGLVLCSMTGLLGAGVGSYDRLRIDGELQAGVGRVEFGIAAGAMASPWTQLISRSAFTLAQSSGATPVTAGAAVVGMACAGLGHAGAYFGLGYLLERSN